MISLVYVSAATRKFDERDLAELLKTSRRNNLAQNVTGMLCFSGGNFMQALEGDDDAVDKLEQTILRDPRHMGMKRIVRVPIEIRQFANWSMALLHPSDLPLHDRAEVVKLANASFDASSEDHSRVALNLLRGFRETMS